MSALLDSDVIIDFLRGLPAAGRYVDRLAVTPTCSEVTRVELLRGVRAHERRVTERFLATVRWAVVDEDISRLAGELGRRFRRSHGRPGSPGPVSGAGRRWGASPAGGRRRGG